MKLVELTEEEFQNFSNNNKYSHFMQSKEWSLVSEKRGKKSVYLGLKENAEVKCATLLIEENLKFGFKHFLAPRGYLIDYKNIDLVKQFTKEIQKYTKNKKAIYFTMDPALEISRIDKDGNNINTDYKKDLVKKYKQIGYKHRGFNDDFSAYNPRYTFEIDMNKSWEEIENGFSKQFRKNAKKSFKYGVEVVEGNKEDLLEFYLLQKKTAVRDGFLVPGFEHFESIYDTFSKTDNIKIFLAKINPTKICANLAKEKEEKLKKKLIVKDQNKIRELDSSIDRINKELFKFDKYKNQGDITISSHMVLYNKDKAWALYAGSDIEFKETFANTRVYYEKFKKSQEMGIKSFDLFGATSQNNDDKSLKGIHDFKNQFGGDYVEYIGEFSKINNKLMYYLYKVSSNIYRNKKRKQKITATKEESGSALTVVDEIADYKRRLKNRRRETFNYSREIEEEIVTKKTL